MRLFKNTLRLICLAFEVQQTSDFLYLLSRIVREFKGHTTISSAVPHATACSPFFATSVSNFSAAPRGCFSPRSH